MSITTHQQMAMRHNAATTATALSLSNDDIEDYVKVIINYEFEFILELDEQIPNKTHFGISV